MGVDPISLAAIAGLVITAAGTGAEIHQSQVAKADAKDAQRKQEAAIRNQNAQLAADQSKLDATQAARQARVRQRALLAGSGTSQTIATSPLGLAQGASGNAPVGGGLKTLGQ